MPTTLPDRSMRVQNDRKEVYIVLLHVLIALFGFSLLAWNMLVFEPGFDGFWSPSNPYHGRYSPAEFSKGHGH
ncbi:MAG: hypothetical protein QOG83_2704 [Alphaproteobacteria bacterium]|nr:hypothetical protein [Alphaproteobacteria bacterium]